MRILLPFILMIALPVHSRATCEDISVPRARFAMAIADREPIGPAPVATPTDHNALFFFMEIKNGAGKRMTHQWFYEGELVAETNLAIGADRWRSWSRKYLGKRRSGQWRVLVKTADGCALADQTLDGSTPIPVLEEATALLKNGDVTGARLLVKNEMANNIPFRQRMERFLNQDVAVAQLEQTIDEQQLYIADARLTQLEQQRNLSKVLSEKLPTLRDQLESERANIKSDTSIALAAFQRVQHRTLTGGKCPATEEELLKLLQRIPVGEHLLLSNWSRDDTLLQATFIDQRTGFLHGFTLECSNAFTGQ